MGKGKEEGTHKELWLCRVAQSSFTELGLMQRNLSLLLYIVQSHKRIEIEGNNHNNLH